MNEQVPSKELNPWELVSDKDVQQLVFTYEMVLTEIRTHARPARRGSAIREWVEKLDRARDEFVQAMQARPAHEPRAEVVALREIAEECEYGACALSYAEIAKMARDGLAQSPRTDLIADAIQEIDAFCDRTNTAWPTLRALRDRLATSSSQPPGDDAAALCYSYSMSEPHLSGYRLILGFETLQQVQAAQVAVARIANTAPTKEV